MLADAGVTLQEGVAAEQKLRELRQMYEPYVQALSEFLLMALPPWFRVTVMPDSWQTSAWEKIITEMATPTHSRGHPNGHFSWGVRLRNSVKETCHGDRNLTRDIG